MNGNHLRCCGSFTSAFALCLACWCSAPASAQVVHGPERIRDVYIPSDQLQLLFDNSSKGVFMPREKILALWEEAQRRVPAAAAPEPDAVLSQAAYEARLEDHELRISGRIQIAKLREGWEMVDLSFGGMAMESARLGGEPARFGRKDDGTLFLVLEKQGRFELDLEMSAPLASKGGDLATTLKLPSAPASEILILLPKAKQLQVGETMVQSEQTDDGRQQFRIATARNGLTPLVISERSAGGNRLPLVLVGSRSIHRVEPAGLRWEAGLDLDVYASPTDTFQIQLPGTMDIAEVESPELSHWAIRQEKDGPATVTLNFRKPVLGRRTVRLLGLAPIPEAKQWDVPTVKVLQAASHVGQVSVCCSPSLQLEVGKLAGIRPQRPTTSTPPAASAPLCFAFWDENFKLPLCVTARRRAVQASIATLIEFNRAGALLRSSLTLQPRHAPVFDVQILLPREWDVASVLCAGTPVPWESAPLAGADPPVDGSMKAVRFALAKPLGPGQALEIALSAQRHPEHWLEEEDRYHELPLPDLRLAGADEVEGTLLVQAPPDIELLVSDLSADLHPMAAGGLQSTAEQTVGTALQYHYQDDAQVSGRIRIRTKPAKVAAETLAFVRLDRGKLDVHYQLDLHIRQGLLRQIGFTLPRAVGEKIQIVPVDSMARIIEQRCSPLSTAGAGKGGLSLWQIVLDRPVTGDLTLALDFGQTCGSPAGQEPVPAEVDAHAAVPVLALRNVSRQSGMVAVEAAGDQQIDCQPKNLRDLDPAEMLEPKGYTVHRRIVAAYQYRRLPYELTVSAKRHPPGSVLTAICESAEITSILGQQGRMRHQARFTLRSLNLPHVPVKLPEGAQLWSAMLHGYPIEVRKTQDTYIVPLPAAQAQSAAATRELTLIYETKDSKQDAGGFSGRFRPRTIRQRAPELGVTTLGVTWRVQPPDGTDLVFAGGDFTPETPLQRPASVTNLPATVASRITSSLPLKFGGLVAALIFTSLFALAKTGKGCSITLVEILVAVVVIGVVIALLLPATQCAREAARRISCNNQLKQIGLALHNYAQAHGQFPPAVIGPPDVPREKQFSWLVALLPYLEQEGLYKQLRLDLPWDHPLNAALLQVPMRGVLCPSDPAPTGTLGNLPKTSYVAVTGAMSTDGSGNPRGIIGFDRGLTFGEIVDGVSNTILVAEAADGGPWFAGGSGTARPIDDWLAKTTWSQHAGVSNFLFGDGSVRCLSVTMNPQTLRCLATAQGMERIVDEEFASESSAPASEVAPDPNASASMPVEHAASDKGAEGPVAEQAPLPAKPPATVAPPAPVGGGERGRLSLGMALDANLKQMVWLRGEGSGGELVLGLQDSAFAHTVPWCMIAAALLAAWIGRRLSGSRRAMIVVVGLAVPIALSGLAPLTWSPLLDGLLLGALAAGCLWTLLEVIAASRKSSAHSAIAVAVVGLGLLSAANVGRAAETRAAEGNPARAASDRQSNLTLFVPYDPDHEIPLEKTQVYLPHDEFLRLWKQAHRDQPQPTAPSVHAVVSYAEYTGRLQDDAAHFDGRVLVHQFTDGWTKVVLPLGKVALEKIEINGRPAALAGDSVPGGARRDEPFAANEPVRDRQAVSPVVENQPAIYLEKAGLHVIDVRFSVPVSRLGATGRMTVPLRPVSSGRLMFQLPVDDLEVSVSGATGGWRRQHQAPAEGGSAVGVRNDEQGDMIGIPLGTANELSIRWQPRRAASPERQLLSVDQTLLVELLDSGAQFHGRFDYRIQQGVVGKLRLRVPRGMAIKSVRGAEVADWSIETHPTPDAHLESQQLVVSLKKELTAGAQLDIDVLFHRRQATGTIDIRGLEPLEVARETGRVAIACSDHLGARVESVDKLDQIDRAGLDLPQKPVEGCALLWAYRYTSRPWRLQLQVERRQSRLEVSDRTAVTVTARQVALRSLLTAEVSGAPVLSFKIGLPASLRVSQVQVPPGADWFIGHDDRGQQLKVELREPAIGKLDLALRGTLARDPGEAELAVPGVVVEEAAAQRGQLAVFLDEDLEAVLVNPGGARPIDPAALDGALRRTDNRPVRYAFQYDRPPKDLRLRLSSAPSRVNGDVTTVVSVREGAVAYITQVDFEIRQAARSRLRVAAPEWLGEDIEIQGPQIRQIHCRADGESRIWEIELQEPIRGDYCLHLIQTLPLPDDGTIRAAMIRPLDVERSRHHIVLENLTADEIAATATRGAAPIPIASVPTELADDVRRQAVAAYRIADGAGDLVWQRRIREQESGLIASISLCDLTMVIHADGRYSTRAAYNIRNFTLQFLELELPPGSEVWSVHVSGQPLRPATVRRQGQTVTLLPLEKISAGDFSSKVVLIYSGRLDEPLRRWTHVRPPAPRILSNVPVSRTLWTVLMPREYTVNLVSSESNVEEVAAEYQQEERKLSFLDELRQMVQVAGSRGKSAAQDKARYNLKQVGAALLDYAEPAQVDAKNAADVQEQAQQIQADIRRLDEVKTDAKRIDGGASLYFRQPPSIAGDEKTPPADLSDKPSDQFADRPEQRRGELRKQAAEQLERLQVLDRKEFIPSEETAPRDTAKAPSAAQQPAAGTGQLSLDLDLTLAGTAYHFRKLHGEPHLALRAYHEDLIGGLSAVVWAGLCMAIAAAIVAGLRRPDPLGVARRTWPWAAAIIGTAWLFLLPMGFLGLILLVTALCVLIVRVRKRQTVGSAKVLTERGNL